jgi:hypothetical protein
MTLLFRGLAALLAAAASLAAPAALADTRTVQGGSLVLMSSLPVDTEITSDTHLSGEVRLSMQGDTSCLSVTSAGAVLVNTSGCGADVGRLSIAVPRGMKLTVTLDGRGDLRLLDDIHAPLTLAMSGSGDVVGHRVMGPLTIAIHANNDVSLGEIAGPVTLDMSGSGDVRLSSVAGPMVLKHAGNGDLAVGRIETDSLVIDSTGSGDMLFGRGVINQLTAHLQGHGDLGIAAEVHDGDVSAHGGGDVKLGQVTGTLTKSNGDNSDIYVGGSDIIDTIVAKVAKAIADSKPDATGSQHSHRSGGTHLLVVLLLGIVAFIAWRILRRPGGLSAGLSSLRGRQAPPAAPTHPGVVALCEKMARMEERLGRVEGYVTSREFDLHQKFRNL